MVMSAEQLAELRHAVARNRELGMECEPTASLLAELDRLRAVVIAQADAIDAFHAAYALDSVTSGAPDRHTDWCRATDATEALGRELRGGPW